MDEIKMYTMDEVAVMLKVTRRTVYKYVENGQLKAVKIGKYWRVSDENLRAFLNGGTDTNDATSKPDRE